MSTKLTVNKCSVWIYGSENGESGWIEGRLLKVGEGFTSEAQAKAWAHKAMKRLNVPGKTRAERFKIGPAY